MSDLIERAQKLSDRVMIGELARGDFRIVDDLIAEVQRLRDDSAEKIIQVSGFPVTDFKNIDYLIVGVTNTGRVVITEGNREWTDISPRPPEEE